jgi:hypothetical protein
MLSMQKLVVGIFRKRAQVGQAINELHQIGFGNRHIRFVKHGISISGMLRKIKSLFRGQNISADEIYHDLVNIGIPPEDARYYQSEFKAGHSIVVVLRSGVPLVATSILVRNGGHIVNEHFAQFTDHSQGTSKSARVHVHFLKGLVRLTQSVLNRHLFASRPTSVEEPTTRDVNVELTSANECIAPSPGNNQGTSVEEPPTEDINAELNSANEHIAPSPDNEKGKEIQETDKDLVSANS